MGAPELPPEFAEAFHELYPRARRLAYRILGNASEAEDAAAEALTRALVAWRRVGQLPYREAWVLRVTANVAIDARRKRQRAAEDEVVVPAGEAEDVTDLRLALAAALAALPRRQREVIALHHLVGLREAEIASCLGVSLGAVKKHGHRGMARLRTALGQEWDSTLGGREQGGVAGVAI